MANFTCKCLNVKIRIISEKRLDDLAKSAIEKRQHDFFSENLLAANITPGGIQLEQSCLVSHETVDSWVISKCLGCGIYTHATGFSSDERIILVNRSLEDERLATDRLSQSPSYSALYRVVLHGSSSGQQLPEAVSGSKDEEIRRYLDEIEHQLNQYLNKEEKLLREQLVQYEEALRESYAKLKTKACRDRNCLVTLLLTAQLDKQSSAAAPSYDFLKSRGNSSAAKSSPVVSIPTRPLPASKVKIDSNTISRVPFNDVFDDDPMFEHDAAGSGPYISDDDGTDEEEYRGRSGADTRSGHGLLDMLSTSAPIKVPMVMQAQQRARDSFEEQAPDMANMAASIRALAHSVRVDGTEMFGELPRPRYTSSSEKPVR